MSHPRPRRLPGRFLGPNSLRRTPMREYPTIADDREMVDRIRACTSIRDEPEVICDDAILDDFAKVGDLRRSQQHALDVAQAQQLRPLLEAEDRVRDIQRRAKYANKDLTHELHIMQRDLDRAKAGNRKPPKRVLERCEGLEALLDGIVA